MKQSALLSKVDSMEVSRIGNHESSWTLGQGHAKHGAWGAHEPNVAALSNRNHSKRREVAVVAIYMNPTCTSKITDKIVEYNFHTEGQLKMSPTDSARCSGKPHVLVAELSETVWCSLKN